MAKVTDYSKTHYSTSFCAFLRGVNVKGTAMKMAEACSVFEEQGMERVSSVLASGNILFSSGKEAGELREIFEKAMSAHFSYEAFLFVKEKAEVEAIFSNNPFEAHPDFHIYGFVGIEGIEKVLMEEFEKSGKAVGENAAVARDHFYWRVPKGDTLGSDFGKILGRKNLKDSFTSRNLNTFEKVMKKM
ncbi:MAG: DUF1697 domain-containing protein [Leadbetterella sp.]|nr:DUF1697 domain-containing protein [Leadbetterella sp.]